VHAPASAVPADGGGGGSANEIGSLGACPWRSRHGLTPPTPARGGVHEGGRKVAMLSRARARGRHPTRRPHGHSFLSRPPTTPSGWMERQVDACIGAVASIAGAAQARWPGARFGRERALLSTALPPSTKRSARWSGRSRGLGLPSPPGCYRTNTQHTRLGGRGGGGGARQGRARARAFFAWRRSFFSSSPLIPHPLPHHPQTEQADASLTQRVSDLEAAVLRLQTSK